MRVFELTKSFPPSERFSLLIRFDVLPGQFARTSRRRGGNAGTKRTSSANSLTPRVKPKKPGFGSSLPIAADIWSRRSRRTWTSATTKSWPSWSRCIRRQRIGPSDRLETSEVISASPRLRVSASGSWTVPLQGCVSWAVRLNYRPSRIARLPYASAPKTDDSHGKSVPPSGATGSENWFAG